MTSCIRLGLAGCSDIFESHKVGLDSLKDRLRLTALCDVDPGKLKKYGQRLSIDRLFDDYRDLVTCSDIDAVLVTTPTQSHAEITVAALQAGKHVLCEKPMALSLEEADRMLAARDASGKVLQLAFMSRHNAAWMKVKDIVDRKELGRIFSCTITQYWNDPRLYKNWRCHPSESGGGIIADSAVHWVDLLRWYMGEIKRVGAVAASAPDSPFPAIEDTAYGVVEFVNGSIGLIRNSWRHQVQGPNNESVEIYGTEGSLFGQMRNPWRQGVMQQVRVLKNGVVTEYEFSEPLRRFERQLAEFADAMTGVRPTLCTGEDGRRALEIQLALYRSIRENAFVPV